MHYAGLVKTGLAALMLSGVVTVWSHPVQAGESTGTWRNGMVAGPYGRGYYSPDGAYYGDGRSYRRRGYAQDYYRPSRSYRRYDYVEEPYPRVYRRSPNREYYEGGW
ncbi:hypothetical protein MicloDRAFT_00002280 [Microvirga lotononidis]|uniref:Uncharacterized protein n=1 Tax=Microvirga lotononidis TaxID=864069 RepID=I4Z4U6_9HYPH|nr:hypothetical protein MicloDRAFT_00002280 [Microvirga lotononidis]